MTARQTPPAPSGPPAPAAGDGQGGAGAKKIQFPPHKVSLTLQHNDPRNVYRTVREVCEAGDGYYREDAWVSEEQRQKAIATNEVWTLQWYPETPVGFCVLHAADFEVLLAAANSEDDQ